MGWGGQLQWGRVGQVGQDRLGWGSEGQGRVRSGEGPTRTGKWVGTMGEEVRERRVELGVCDSRGAAAGEGVKHICAVSPRTNSTGSFQVG